MSFRTDSKSLGKGVRRAAFYVSNFLRYYTPDMLWHLCFNIRMGGLTEEEKLEARRRADYYCRLPEGATIRKRKSQCVGDFTYPFGQKKKFATYFFDLHKFVRLFPREARFVYIPGDIEFSIDQPAIVKARAVCRGTTDAVVMKLNSVRHFHFIRDEKPFVAKRHRLIFRNFVLNQPWRQRLLDAYCNHPLCDFGRINAVDDGHPEYTKDFIPINKQLDSMFILCIEGNDVATNLKWVMSSNSIAVMPRPKMESWFMEGVLKPDYHYIEVKEDYSDLIEKTDYYAKHVDEAEAIIRHAHAHVARFGNKRVEDWCSFLVLKKYFESIEVIP